MVSKKNKPTPKAKKEMGFPAPADKPKANAMAKLALRPSVNAGAVVESFTPLGEQDLGALVEALSEETQGMQDGDMKRAEAMLYGQAHALQAIFVSLARKATGMDQLKQWDAFLRMALKAQNQCRMTLETLATIKNPPVVFARQANINNGGQQQVNNGAAADGGTVRAGACAGAPAHAAISRTDQTELLESGNGQWLDTRTKGTTIGADPHVETVGAINGPAHG
jgi:hypothetical protein